MKSGDDDEETKQKKAAGKDCNNYSIAFSNYEYGNLSNYGTIYPKRS